MAVRSMTDTAQIPLILLSGMGADDRVFAPQRAAFPHLQVPAWTDPQPGETLAEYAARFASRVDPGGPCFIGGASLGGMVAMEMAVHLNASAVFLIGSVPDAKQLPFRVRMWKPCAGLIRWIPVGAVQCLSRISRVVFRVGCRATL